MTTLADEHEPLVADDPLPRRSIPDGSKCDLCHGAGEFRCDLCHGHGSKNETCNLGHVHSEDCAACDGRGGTACLRCLGLGCTAAARERALRLFVMPVYVQRAVCAVAAELDALGLPVVEATVNDTAVTYAVTVEICRDHADAVAVLQQYGFTESAKARLWLIGHWSKPLVARDGYVTMCWSTRVDTADAEPREVAL